jgi:hypothetical protein
MSKYSELVDYFLRGMGVRVENRKPREGILAAASHNAISDIFAMDASRIDDHEQDMLAIRYCGRTHDGRTIDDIRRERDKGGKQRRGIVFG